VTGQFIGDGTRTGGKRLGVVIPWQARRAHPAGSLKPRIYCFPSANNVPWSAAPAPARQGARPKRWHRGRPPVKALARLCVRLCLCGGSHLHGAMAAVDLHLTIRQTNMAQHGITGTIEAGQARSRSRPQ
jgi:hypothetical protein